MCTGTTRRGDKNNSSTLPPLIPHCHGPRGWDRAVGTEPGVSGLLCHPQHISPAPAGAHSTASTAAAAPGACRAPSASPATPEARNGDKGAPLCPSPARVGERGCAEEPCGMVSADLEMLDGMDVGTLPTHSSIRAAQIPTRQGCSLSLLLSQGAWGLRKAHSVFSFHTRGLK